MFIANDDRGLWYLKKWFDARGKRHTLWTTQKHEAMDFYDRRAAARMVHILRQGGGYRTVKIVE